MEELMKRTKLELVSHVQNLESENDRLTSERNAAIMALERWKKVNDIGEPDDDVEKMTLDCIKRIMRITDKVRTRF